MTVDLRGEVVAVRDLRDGDARRMFALMDLVYAGMDRAVFDRDLADKDEVILLHTPAGELAGFSTQRFVTVDGVAGLFSGDTVVHPAHRGGPALFQVFARRYVLGEHPPLRWFLVSKGHRTYRMLPAFFATYWPSRRAPTPPAEQHLMDAYAAHLYPDDYNPTTGVLEYRCPKDRLRDTSLTDRERQMPDVEFFVARNPGWSLGHDLVCLTDLAEANVLPRTLPLRAGAAAVV